MNREEAATHKVGFANELGTEQSSGTQRSEMNHGGSRFRPFWQWTKKGNQVYADRGEPKNDEVPIFINTGLSSLKQPRKPIVKFLKSPMIQLLMINVLIISVFIYDSWVIANNPDTTNMMMNGILLGIMGLFFTKGFLLLLYDQVYRTSFVLPLDIIILVSLVFDLSWITERLTVLQHPYTLGVSRAIKIVSKYSRIVRFTYALKILKDYLFQSYSSSLNNENDRKQGYDIQDAVVETMHTSLVHKASAELSEQLSLRVAMIILILAIIGPYLSYNMDDYSVNSWIYNLQYDAKSNTTTSDHLSAVIHNMQQFYYTRDIQVLSVYMTGPYLITPLQYTYESKYDVVRLANQIKYYEPYTVDINGTPQSYDITIIMDETLIARMQSIFFLILVAFALTMLFLFAWSFHYLLQNDVIEPLHKLIVSLKTSAETMIRNVRAMSLHFGNDDLLDDDDDDDDEEDEEEDDNETRAHTLANTNNNASLPNVLPFSDVNSVETSGKQTTIHSNHSNTLSNYSTSFPRKHLFGGGGGGRGGHAGGHGELHRQESHAKMLARPTSFFISDDIEALVAEVDAANQLEKLVEKLTRMLKHMLPGGAPVVEIESGQIDQATETWLNENYLQKQKRQTISVTPNTNPVLESIRLQELAEKQTVVSLEVLNSWNFDVLAYSNQQLCEVLIYLFSVHNFFIEFTVPAGSFHAFIKQLASRYDNNFYHNFKHGSDVCHTIHRFMSLTRLDSGGISRIELFSIMVAALAHDVGHPGVNNIYLVRAKDELALRHNDKSPLENMHCAVLYEILSHNETNIFGGLSEIQWRESRKVILSAILATDMVHHYDQITKAQLFHEVNGRELNAFSRGDRNEAECLSEDNNRLFLLELLLHCADISNPGKPFFICEKWSRLVAEEFATQGDKEKMNGWEVSPMMDREQMILCNMQMGFIEFVVTPLVTAVVNLFPPMYEIGTFMTQNFTQWGAMRKLEIVNGAGSLSQENQIEECKKIDERTQRYLDKMSFLTVVQSKLNRKTRRGSGNISVNESSRNLSNSPSESHLGRGVSKKRLSN